MKPSFIASALRALVQARQPVFVWSGPGCGKSAVTRQVAAELNLQLRGRARTVARPR
jgi:MoxR-like ATPase